MTIVDSGPTNTVEVEEIGSDHPSFSDTLDLFKKHGIPLNGDPSVSVSVIAKATLGLSQRSVDENDIWRNRG